MPKMKRHTEAEIAAKLAEADVLNAQGRTQDEIARALGISVMTFHRWRKAHQRGLRSEAASKPETTTLDLIPPRHIEPPRLSRVAELQLENTRLRKLVTDLLLEKMRLEEQQYSGGPTARKR